MVPNHHQQLDPGPHLVAPLQLGELALCLHTHITSVRGVCASIVTAGNVTVTDQIQVWLNTINLPRLSTVVPNTLPEAAAPRLPTAPDACLSQCTFTQLPLQELT